MNAPEIRIVVETRQPDGQWRPAVTIPLNDEQRDMVASWAADASNTIWPGDISEASDAVIGESLWALPDDVLLELLEGENGEAIGMALVEYLPDFDATMEQRFGVSVMLEFCARRLSSQGLDGAAFSAGHSTKHFLT